MLPLTLAPPPTLADLADQALDDGLATGSSRCIWCGDEAVAAAADRWTGSVLLRCPACGSELEGWGRRRGHEVRA